MNRTKDKYFEILVREESMIKYNIRANDEDQARRIFEEYGEVVPTTTVVSKDKHIIEIGEGHDPF